MEAGRGWLQIISDFQALIIAIISMVLGWITGQYRGLCKRINQNEERSKSSEAHIKSIEARIKSIEDVSLNMGEVSRELLDTIKTVTKDK